MFTRYVVVQGTTNNEETMSIHGEIMNIRSRNPYKQGTPSYIAYEQGHRDARHDAAELAEVAVSEAESERPATNDFRHFIPGRHPEDKT